MEEIKHSKQADKIGNLYRAALFLARGDSETGQLFLKRSVDLSERTKTLYKTLVNETKRSNDISRKRLIAEKILDEYKRQMYSLTNCV